MARRQEDSLSALRDEVARALRLKDEPTLREMKKRIGELEAFLVSQVQRNTRYRRIMQSPTTASEEDRVYADSVTAQLGAARELAQSLAHIGESPNFASVPEATNDLREISAEASEAPPDSGAAPEDEVGDTAISDTGSADTTDFKDTGDTGDPDDSEDTGDTADFEDTGSPDEDSPSTLKEARTAAVERAIQRPQIVTAADTTEQSPELEAQLERDLTRSSVSPELSKRMTQDLALARQGPPPSPGGARFLQKQRREEHDSRPWDADLKAANADAPDAPRIQGIRVDEDDTAESPAPRSARSLARKRARSDARRVARHAKRDERGTPVVRREAAENAYRKSLLRGKPGLAPTRDYMSRTTDKGISPKALEGNTGEDMISGPSIADTLSGTVEVHGRGEAAQRRAFRSALHEEFPGVSEEKVASLVDKLWATEAGRGAGEAL